MLVTPLRAEVHQCVLCRILEGAGFPGGSDGKESPAMQETQVQSLGAEDSLEKGMATYSSILAWRIPRTEEPGRLTKSRTRLSS